MTQVVLMVPSLYKQKKAEYCAVQYECRYSYVNIQKKKKWSKEKIHKVNARK